MIIRITEDSFKNLSEKIKDYIADRDITKRLINSVTAGYYSGRLRKIVMYYWEKDREYATFLIALYRLSKKHTVIVNYPKFSLCVLKGSTTKNIHYLARNAWMGY